MQNQTFEYPKDEAFFQKLFSDSGGLETNLKLFDFRDPQTKRKELMARRHLLNLLDLIIKIILC